MNFVHLVCTRNMLSLTGQGFQRLEKWFVKFPADNLLSKNNNQYPDITNKKLYFYRNFDIQCMNYEVKVLPPAHDFIHCLNSKMRAKSVPGNRLA